MGLAFISGMRLYSTVLAVGLGIRFDFLQLPENLAHLEPLASTPVLWIAGAIYSIEFLADKIPWIDSLWDAVHTFIRPIGAAVLGVVALGNVAPEIQIGAFLLSGTVGLVSHSAKAGTRLVANHSPEPLSNIGLSLAEDGIVAAGAWAIFAHPIPVLIIVSTLLVAIVWAIPQLLRLFRGNIARGMSPFAKAVP